MMTLTGVVVCLANATKEGSGFGLCSGWDAGDGSEASQLSHGLGVDAESKDPGLTSGIVG